MYNEGNWTRDYQKPWNDSQNKNVHKDENAPFLSRMTTIGIGTVLLPEIEGVNKQGSVMVDMVSGGVVTGVSWPGAQVNANASGLPGGLSIGIHGLHESPLPGQQVAIGYIDGSWNNPVVLAKYPYNASQRIDLEAMHFLPMIQKSHGPTDVVLGHHTGSFIALRGTVPVPGEIDIVSPTVITISALAAITVTVGSAYTVTVGGAVSITAGATMGLTSTGVMSITASAISMLPTTALTIGSGTEPMLKGASSLVELTKDGTMMTTLQTVLATWVPVPTDGGLALKTLLTAFLALPPPVFAPTLLSTKVLAE